MATGLKSTLRRGSCKRLMSKSDLLTLLPQGKRRSPVQVRVVVERGTISIRSLGRQIKAFWKVC